MASTPKGPQMINIDYKVDRKIYDEFVRQCSHKGMSPKVIIERLMIKYSENPNI